MAEAKRSSSHIPIPQIIAGCDDLCNAGKAAEVGEFLRLWLRRARDAGDESGELTILSELLGHYRLSNDRERGLATVKDALELLKKLGQTNTAGGGTILLNAATVLQAFGENEHAKVCYRGAFNAYRLNLDEDDWRFAGLYNNMASVYIAEKEYKKAENFYLNALDILNMYGKIMDCATTYVNLAQLAIIRMSPVDMVHTYLDCAMQSFNHPAVVRDGYYAHTCSKCAEVFFMAGREADGEELLARMEEIYGAD